MPILTGTIDDVTGSPLPDRVPLATLRVTVRAPSRRSSLTEQARLVASVPVPVEVSPTGEISVELEPGPAVMLVEGEGLRDVYELGVTADMTLLTEALQEMSPTRSWVESQMVQLRSQTVTAAADAQAAKSDAQAAKSDAETAAGDAETHRTHVDAIRDLLDEAAQNNVAPYLTQTALNDTYGPDAWADSESEVRQQAREVVAEVAKFDHGGAVLRPVRQPTLAYGKQFPNHNAQYDILWASGDGQTLYATAKDNTLRKSTTKGRTWEAKGYHAAGFGGSQVFVKTKANTLLTFEAGFPLTNKILRSTDDGTTWTEVFSDPVRQAAGCAPMHTTSMCQDPVTGHIYWGEYQTGQAETILVYRSVDDGATWQVFHTFPGLASTDEWKVRHIHAIEYDHVMGRIVVMTGDDEPKSGIYRVNAAGTGLEPILTNDQCDGWPNNRQARSICYIPFTDYIVWGGDTTSWPWIMRMHRSEVGKPNPKIEHVYRANSTMWFAAKASPDGSRWLMTASQEAASPVRLDAAAHIYAIEDQGATVTEVGAVNMNTPAIAAPFPLGGSNPTGGGDQVWLAVYEHELRTVWRCQLTRGGGQAIPQAEPRPAVSGLQSVSSGYVTVPAGGQITFGATQAPTHPRPRFRLFEASVRGLPAQNAALRFEIQSNVGNKLWELPTTSTSYRRLLNQAWSPFLYDLLVNPSYELMFVVKNTGTSDVSGVVHVTFGWGVDLTP